MAVCPEILTVAFETRVIMTKSLYQDSSFSEHEWWNDVVKYDNFYICSGGRVAQ